jgi:hypothetical protein
VFFHKASATLILSDAIMNLELDKIDEPWRTANKLSGMYYPHGQIFFARTTGTQKKRPCFWKGLLYTAVNTGGRMSTGGLIIRAFKPVVQFWLNQEPNHGRQQRNFIVATRFDGESARHEIRRTARRCMRRSIPAFSNSNAAKRATGVRR